jgi:diguanylate cyclase (GGDEF)-like protein/PAS domain S-box-containing protein
MTKNSIRLGLLTPLTGIVSIYGEDIARAGQIATDSVNDSGGLLGRKLELIIADDGSLPETAVPAAKRLVQEDGCHAIIGNLLSNSRIAVSDQVSVPTRTPYLNFSFYEGSIFNRYFFHFAALPNQQIDKMIPYMAKHFGMKMYFAGNNYEWPRGSIDAAKLSLERIGGETVGEQYLSIGVSEEEVEWVLDGVARSGADVFVPYFAGQDQLLVLNRFYDRGLKKHMAVVMGHYDELLVSYLNPEVRDGLYSSNTYFMSVETDENAALLERLEQYPGVNGVWPNGNGTITNFSEGAFTCVTAYADAVRRADTTESEKVIEALESLRFNAPQGEVIMDSDTHHAHVNSYLSRCNLDGSFSIIEEFGCIAPEIPSRYKELFLVQESKGRALSPEETAKLAKEVAEHRSDLNDTKRILDVADMAILATDSSGIITAANRGTAEVFGYTEDELVGMPMRLLVPPHMRQRHDKAVKWFIESEAHEMRMGKKGEKTGYRKDGTFFPLEASIAKFEGGDDWVLVATLQDLTETKKSQEELTRQATHDPLTGLPNRALLHERISNVLNRSKRRDDNIALLFVDLDGFKAVNDSHGHDAGDHLLKTLSTRMLESVRPGDTVARFAGDEFVVLCENVSEPENMATLADRLNEAMRTPVEYDSIMLGVTASIGIALGHGTTHSADDLLRYADNAMYSVKETRRDSWSFFNESLQQAAHQRLAISNGLRFALERGEFEVVFQPIVTLETEVIAGAETLLRWNSPEGPVSPAVFIPISEMNGTIVPIGKWVFEQACRAQRRWKNILGNRSPYITVNISARQFADEHLVQTFIEILQATNADPKKLVLEVTETSLMSDVTGNIKTLNELRKTGMKVAVDDFGTGYSSLSQLVRLEVDTLKIDRMFVWEFDKSSENEAIVAAISRMAKSLNIRLVAEGIESEDQLNEMLTLGVQSGQGYLFSKPIPESDFLALFDSNVGTFADDKNDVYFIVYASKSDASVDVKEIRNIQKQSQSLNRKHRITGHLVYHQGVFIQYIEGPKDNVESLYERISNDTRHHNVTLLAEGVSERRLFIGWSMGAQSLNKHGLTNLAGYQLDTKELFIKYKNNPELCLSFFELVSMAI